jgi:sucrose-6-phosphate hydrolase SacC (GH32 family)
MGIKPFESILENYVMKYMNFKSAIRKQVILLVLFYGLSNITSTAQSNEIVDVSVLTGTDAAREVRINELNDPIRPTWHLTIADGKGYPFDPNGAIYKDGIYNLWYLYQVDGVHHWQHLKSIDLFHWRWMSNDLQPIPGDPEIGIFSGNAFLANDGNVVMAYHGLGTDGNCVAYSSDPDLNIWEKSKANPISKLGWDPHMWVQNNTYYQISGGKPVSSGNPNPPMLFKGQSYDKPLEEKGNFMAFDMPEVDNFEDISCPDFFKLDDKWVLVCISHTRGARYYIGSWDGIRFRPESHHRMNWKGGSVFAPETLLDNKDRRILWAWVLDRKSGVSSGTMSMPRVLTLSKDKLSLNINPPEEVQQLRYNAIEEKPFTINIGQSVMLNKINGKSLEINITITPGKAQRFGLKVFSTKDGKEHTNIVIDKERNVLQIDVSKSSLEKPDYKEFLMMRESSSSIDIQDAPFILKNGEKVNLRIFLDKSMLEVFANGRQCITQVVYPTMNDALNVEVFTEDSPIKVEEIKSWSLFPSMQW